MLSPRKVSFYAKKNERINYRFRTWLKLHADPDKLDEQFYCLHQELFSAYDVVRQIKRGCPRQVNRCCLAA